MAVPNTFRTPANLSQFVENESFFDIFHKSTNIYYNYLFNKQDRKNSRDNHENERNRRRDETKPGGPADDVRIPRSANASTQ